MLVNKRAALRGVALEAGFVSAQESKAAGFEGLLDIRATAFDGDSLVRIMTIGATHFAFQHRVMMRQLELCAHFEVTLETSFRRFARIDDRTSPAACFNVQTARPVARLAAHVLCIFSFRLQSRVRSGAKVAHDLFVAGRALLSSDELRPRDAGRRQNCSVCGAAGKQNDGQRGCSPDTPQNSLALTVHPSS